MVFVGNNYAQSKIAEEIPYLFSSYHLFHDSCLMFCSCGTNLDSMTTTNNRSKYASGTFLNLFYPLRESRKASDFLLKRNYSKISYFFIHYVLIYRIASQSGWWSVVQVKNKRMQLIVMQIDFLHFALIYNHLE